MPEAPTDGSRPPARETAAVLAAAVQFALIMTANFVLRSVRDEMGVAGGVDNLPWMFSATLGGTLVLVPAYGLAASRLGRRGLATAIYGALALSMVLLWAAFAIVGEPAPALGRVTFVWLSVINMVAVAGFWSAVVDLFSGDRARRGFGTIAAGGTVGALAGPSLALLLVGSIGVHGLLLVAAALWLGAVLAAWWLERHVAARVDVAPARVPVGGSLFTGLRELVRTPSLRGLAVHVLAFTATSTVLYLVQARIVRDAVPDGGDRTALFASIDLAVNVLALALQLGVTGRLLRRLSLSSALAVLPGVTVVVLVGLAAAPVLATLIGVQVLRRAAEYAFGKPARELLYEHVPRVTKFHGQNAVDTAVYRAGDAACAWLVEGLAALGVGPSALLLGFAGVAVAWLRFAQWLGRSAARPSRGAPG